IAQNRLRKTSCPFGRILFREAVRFVLRNILLEDFTTTLESLRVSHVLHPVHVTCNYARIKGGIKVVFAVYSNKSVAFGDYRNIYRPTYGLSIFTYSATELGQVHQRFCK